MKISAYYKKQGFRIILSRDIEHIKADRYYASAVFSIAPSHEKVAVLKDMYHNNIDIGGSGICLNKRLPPEIESCFPDYKLYNHTAYALGFLTRGCNKRCTFCLVPKKEGKVKRTDSFENFVPKGQRNVMLLDDNLLTYPRAKDLLNEMIIKKYAINFSQSLDIQYVNDHISQLLYRVDSRNSKFTKPMIYFSCNSVKTIKHFVERKNILKDFGEDRVSVIAMYGFDTHLSEDYERFAMIKKLRLIPFLQEYYPIGNVLPKLPNNFFDMDMDKVICLTFRSNGINWEKYLRWLNKLYFNTFGKYYLPLIKIIYRYNNKNAINKYLKKPHLLTTDMYRFYKNCEKMKRKDSMKSLKE
jgi:hypothetical protein